MDLCDALGVRPGDIVALVGGGGKTSAMYRLGRELAARGLPVVLSGTAKFTLPESGVPPPLTVLSPEAAADALPAGPWPLTVAAGHGSKGRLLPITPEWVAALHAARPDWTLVLEADGSAMRPFKAPAAHEPAIPPCATLVVPVVGIDVIGRTLDDRHVHRSGLVAGLAGVDLGVVVDTDMVAAVLLHPAGGRKGTPPGARWIPLINKADTPERLERAETLAERLRQGTERVIIASLRAEPPVIRQDGR